MSFWSFIGHVRSGFGLSELLEVTNSPNTVTHILNVRAIIVRAVRHSVEDVRSARCLLKIQEKVETHKTQMAAKRTSKPWL